MAAPQGKPMFANQEEMKEKVWEALKKPQYNVADFYHKTGIWRRLATHSVFENFTLAVISINALWIAIDTDNNTASTLLQAQPIFQIAEHAFCWYFCFEWYVRFSAFQNKRDGLKDKWFVFDSCLVFMMVAETWVMTIVLLCLDSGGSSGMGGASILRLFRLLRLSRLARMLRSMPELMILIKGMVAASRSVFFTMCLLIMGMYLFAIMMRQLTEGTSVGDEYFHSVPASMYKLLIEGVFLDNLGETVDTIADSSPLYAAIFFVFLVFAALMVMNMLIGVLCEVVSAVASTEKEEMNVLALRSKLDEVVQKLDKNRNGVLSEKEFVTLISDSQVVTLLNEIGVDAIGLIDHAPTIFETTTGDDDDGDGGATKVPHEIEFEKFVEIVLEHRGSNTASLKDLRDMKHELASGIDNIKSGIDNVKAMLTGSKRGTSSTLSTMSTTMSLPGAAQIVPSSLPDSSGADAHPTCQLGQGCLPFQASSTLSTSMPLQWATQIVPCRLPDSSGANAQSAEALVLKPSSQAPSVRDEDVSSHYVSSVRGGTQDGIDTEEVESLLQLLQGALRRLQRPSLHEAARTSHENDVLDWVDSMSGTATSELKKLQRLQTSRPSLLA